MIAAISSAAVWAIWLAVLACAAALSFAYSALEIGIYVMNKIRLDLRAEGGSPAARRLRDILSNQRNFLAVLLIGNNIATYAATFAISALFIHAGHGEASEWYTLLVATPLLFVLCESLPKNVAHRVAEKLVYRLAPLLRASSFLFNACGLAPLMRGYSWLLTRLIGKRHRQYIPLGHEGLSAIVAEGHAAGVLTHLQTVMVDRVIHIAEVKLQDVMIPMNRVVWTPMQISHEDMLNLMRAHNFSRFPMRDAAGQVVSILNIYDALAAADNAPPTGKTTQPLIVNAASSVTDALYRMQRTHSPMAVVADSQGKHIGIVTVKDLVEEIVGELQAW